MEFDEQSLQRVRQGRLLISRYDDWLFDEFQSFLGQRILEIGCGLGNLLSRFTDRQLVIGIETSEAAVLETRQRFQDFRNIHVLAKDITQPDIFMLGDLYIDTIISLNVFEHLEYDELALRNCMKLLQPRGYLILIVPAHQFLYGEMDRSIGHYRRYSKSSLHKKLERAGFGVISQKYLNMVGAMGWWFNGCFLSKRTPPDGQLKLFNTIVPILRAMENMGGAPFGISLLSISQKP